MSPQGEELIISFIRPGEMVGELAVVDGLRAEARTWVKLLPTSEDAD